MLIGALALLVSVPVAQACTLDDVDGSLSRDTLNHFYPGALDVLARVVDARRAAGLPPSPGLTPSPLHVRGLMGLTQRLHQQMRAANGDTPAPPIALLLIEAMLWSRFPAPAGMTAPDLHASGPVDGDVVIVTSEDAVRQIVAGRLAMADAEAKSMLRIYGPPPARARIAAAFGSIGAAPAR